MYFNDYYLIYILLYEHNYDTPVFLKSLHLEAYIFLCLRHFSDFLTVNETKLSKNFKMNVFNNIHIVHNVSL